MGTENLFLINLIQEYE